MIHHIDVINPGNAHTHVYVPPTVGNGITFTTPAPEDLNATALSSLEIQLTADDSWAATILAQDPRLSPSDIARHPMRNVLTSVLGARDQVDVHLSEHVLLPGDTVLLSSDGLHGVLDAHALAAAIESEPGVSRLARRLVETALERGSRDNVTAVVVRYDGASA